MRRRVRSREQCLELWLRLKSGKPNTQPRPWPGSRIWRMRVQNYWYVVIVVDDGADVDSSIKQPDKN